MTAHPAAVLRRAATLAPTVLPPQLAELAADELGVELAQLDAGAPDDGVDERYLHLAREILGLLPEDYAARARREIDAAGWRPGSPEITADLLRLIDTWDQQGPAAETRILLAQIRQLFRDQDGGGDQADAPQSAQPARLSFQDELAEDIMFGYDEYLRDKRGTGETR